MATSAPCQKGIPLGLMLQARKNSLSTNIGFTERKVVQETQIETMIN